MVCPPATSEAEARWPRFGLVVIATTSRRDNKDQMIRPLGVVQIWNRYRKSGGNDQKEFLHHGY
jgi:hypothetical protein